MLDRKTFAVKIFVITVFRTLMSNERMMILLSCNTESPFCHIHMHKYKAILYLKKGNKVLQIIEKAMIVDVKLYALYHMKFH